MLVRHSLVYIATNLVAGLFGFATTLILTRLVTPAEYGVFGVGSALVYFASNTFFDWQATTYLRLGQGTGDRDRVTGTFVGLFMMCMAVSLIAAIPFALLATEEVGAGIVWLALPCVWAYAWFQFTSRVHTAALRPGQVMLMNVVRGAVGLAAAVLVAHETGRGAYILLASFSGALFGSMVRMAAVSHVRAPWREKELSREAIRFGLPMAMAFVISGVSSVVNRILLAQMGSLAAAGFYSVGAVLVQNTIGLMAAGVGVAAYSLAVRSHETGNAAETNAQLANNFTLLFGLLLPSAVGLAMVAPALIPRLVGAEFVGPAVELTPYVAVAAFFGTMRAHYADTAFHLAKRTGLLTGLLATTAVLEIALGYFLIPRFGYMAPAYAALASQVTSLVIALSVGRWVRPLPLPLGAIAKVLIATALMAAAVELMPLRTDLPGLAAPILAGGLVYAIAVIAFDLLGLRGSARRFVGRILNRKGSS